MDPFECDYDAGWKTMNHCQSRIATTLQERVDAQDKEIAFLKDELAVARGQEGGGNKASNSKGKKKNSSKGRGGTDSDPSPVIDFAPVIKAVVDLKQELKEQIDTSDAGNDSASALAEMKEELAEARVELSEVRGELSELSKKMDMVLAGNRGGNGERKRATASSSTKKRGGTTKKKKKKATEDEVFDEPEGEDEEWLREQERLRGPARQDKKNVVQQPMYMVPQVYPAGTAPMPVPVFFPQYGVQQGGGESASKRPRVDKYAYPVPWQPAVQHPIGCQCNECRRHST